MLDVNVYIQHFDNEKFPVSLLGTWDAWCLQDISIHLGSSDIDDWCGVKK